ncbi:MAG: glycosyltransferase family 2 protein [Patescibacteria group bacterium]
MKVSVIIPTYNEEKVIGECLKSLLGQSLADFEVIVVDDGSTDTTMLKLRSASKTERVKVFTQGHRGAGAARNLGVKHAKGEILVFVDADMTFGKEFLKNLIKPIGLSQPGRSRTIYGTFSKEEYLGNADNVWARCWNINRGLPINKMHSKNYPDNDKVFRAILKSEFDRAGGFDEKTGYTDDYSLSQKLGVMAVTAPGAIFYHNNPDSLEEVFIQSKWVAKRKYKLGMIGSLGTLIARSLPFSILFGIVIGLTSMTPQFLIFRIISDFGQFVGILEYMFGGKVSK